MDFFALPLPHRYFTGPVGIRWPGHGHSKYRPTSRLLEGPELSDIFREVDEEVRRERLQQLWDRYGYLIIAAAVVIVTGVGAWRGYQWWDAKKAAEAGAAFEVAMTASVDGKHAEAEAAFAKIAAEGSSGYRTLARFRAAAEPTQSDPQAAVKAYDALAADTGIGRVMQDLAALRAGLILADKASYDEMNARLEAVAASDRTFRHTAREILALTAWRTGDRAAAKRWFDLIMTDPETPASTRTRVQVLITLSGPDVKS